LKHKTNVGCWVNVLFPTLVDPTLMYLYNSKLGYWRWSNVRSQNIDRHYTNIVPKSKMMLGQHYNCDIGPTNWWHYPNVVPINDCYLGSTFYKN